MKNNKTLLFISLSISILGFLLAYFYVPGERSASETSEVDSLRRATETNETIKKAMAGSHEVKSKLLEWAKADHFRERELAASYLWRYQEQDALAALEKLTQDKVLDVRIRAFHSLSKRTDQEAMQVIKKILADNSKADPKEKLMLRLNLLKARNQKPSVKDIDLAIAELGLDSKGAYSDLKRNLLLALVSFPEGAKKLKTHLESGKTNKINTENAAIVVSSIGSTCPQNRYEYLNFVSSKFNSLSSSDQTRTLNEFRRHGKKGAALIQLVIAKENKLPDGYKNATLNYLSKKNFDDFCAKK